MNTGPFGTYVAVLPAAPAPTFSEIQIPITGTGAPTGVPGSPRLVYTDTSSNKVYQNVGGAWVLMANVD